MRFASVSAFLLVSYAAVASAQPGPTPAPAPAPTDAAPAPTAPATPAPTAEAAPPPTAPLAPAPVPEPTPSREVPATAPATRDPSAVQPTPAPSVQVAPASPPPSAPPPARALPPRRGEHPPLRAPLPPPMVVPPPRLESELFAPRKRGDAGAPFTVGMGATLLWRRDRGYDYLAERDRTPELELAGTYDVLAPGARFVIAAGASYRHFAGSGDDGLELVQHTVQAELVARYAALSWLVPHARLAAGVVTTRVDLPLDSADSFEDRDTGFAGSLGAGLTLRTPARLFESRRGRAASLGFGVLADGGYTYAPAADFRARASREHGLSRAPLSIGSLERKSPYVRVLAVVRF